LARFFEDYTEVSVPTPSYEAEESGVYQDVCGEISEYDAPISKWYDTIYIGGDLPLQSANHTLSPDRSGRVSHLEAAAGASRRTDGGDHRKGSG